MTVAIPLRETSIYAILNRNIYLKSLFYIKKSINVLGKETAYVLEQFHIQLYV